MEIENGRAKTEQIVQQPNNDFPSVKRIRAAQGETQPPMMSFKAFLHSQDDNISDEEASAKYSEYKLEFRRQQLKDFFVAHKDEDWFQLKYHPIKSVKRKEELKARVQRRAAVFVRMLNSGSLDGISLITEKEDTLEKLMDSFVVLLEESEASVREESKKESEEISNAGKLETKEKRDDVDGNKKDFEWIILDDVGGEEEEEEDPNTKLETVNDALLYSETDKGTNSSNESDNAQETERESESFKRNDSSKSQMNSQNANSQFYKNESKPHNEENLLFKAESEGCPSGSLHQAHKSRSIFLRNISPRISRKDIEEVCGGYPGYRRLWLSDGQPELGWSRRGFVTFTRDVNIKQICWNLNSTKINGCEWQAVVNHDLVKRIRSANILANHKQVVMADLKLATKLIQALDRKAGLWGQEQLPLDSTQEDSIENVGAGGGSRNPLWSGMMDHLVEEAPAEAEELLGQSAVLEEVRAQTADKLKILDKVVLYLRLVHSVDYYNGSQYQHEDEMPSRCGIMHLRGPTLPPTQTSQEEVDEYIAIYEGKFKTHISPPPPLTQPALLLLGLRESSAEIEKFIKANTQELSPEKFLCPLSGKKFKAPEFVRKHILNKFPHELDHIRFEVDYFNNYLKDPKRPELPDHPGIAARKEYEQQPQIFHYPAYRRGFPFPHYPGFFMRGRGMPMARGRGGEFRTIVTYRDLDAPTEPDEII